MIARVLSSTRGANNTMMLTSLMTLPCTQEYVIVKFHHIMNMHDQFMGMNTIQQPFLSCLPAFYALAIPMTCYISNIFYWTTLVDVVRIDPIILFFIKDLMIMVYFACFVYLCMWYVRVYAQVFNCK